MGKKGIIKIRYDKDMAKKLHEERQSAVVRNKEIMCLQRLFPVLQNDGDGKIWSETRYILF